jgi:hypothetical protein
MSMLPPSLKMVSYHNPEILDVKHYRRENLETRNCKISFLRHGIMKIMKTYSDAFFKAALDANERGA